MKNGAALSQPLKYSQDEERPGEGRGACSTAQPVLQNAWALGRH